PDGLGDAGAGHRTAGVAHQELEQRELARAQVHHALALGDATGERIEHDVADVERGVLVAQLGATDQRVHARQQLRQIERLGEVVVGAALEALHPRLQLVARREQEHRREHAARAHLGHDAEAVAAGQHDVEHDAAEAATQRLLERPVAGGGLGDAVALFAEGLAQETPQVAVVFDQVPGVLAVTVGYAGGRLPHPSYDQVSTGRTGHLESVQVVYDANGISYARLVDAFWHDIDPTQADGQFCDHGPQYHTAVFYRDSAERRVAEASLRALERRFGKPITTALLRATTFYPAEQYHQHYYKKNP